ncbi:MAG: membrane protein [Rhodospirillaceae bacterium BRH_c57]|nr:MAG: membrane protein [Rhodospirillaceae bacterium BRH_c57]
MSLDPLLQASPAIQAHAVAALAAFALGIMQLAGVKGGARHRVIGWSWVAAMAVTAASGFFIQEIIPGAFSPIHLLSLMVLVLLPVAIVAVRRGRVRTHRMTMIGMFAGGLIIAGLFTLLPGRIMHALVFGPVVP